MLQTRPLQASYKKMSEVRGLLMQSNSCIFQLRRSTSSASRITNQMKPFPRSEFTLALNLDILDAGRSPNAVRHHAGTAQGDFDVNHPPLADSRPGDLLITMVKETVNLYLKSFEKWKQWNFFVSLIYLKVMKLNLNAIDCEIACDCVKPANVVAGLKKEFFCQDACAHSYPQADLCSAPYSDNAL